MKPASKTSVLFHANAREEKLRQVDRRTVREFARRLTDEVAVGQAFCCLITDDAELRRLNREFRNEDYATDVLSFPAGDGGPAELASAVSTIGEIAISLDRAEQQAQALAHSTEQELQILMLHGVLHLTGLDHEKDRGEMARVEQRWRRHFGLPAGLIERVSP